MSSTSISKYLLLTSLSLLLVYTAFNIGTTEPPPSSDKFAGSDSCKQCHLAQWKDWEGSHHAQAQLDVFEGAIIRKIPNGPVIDKLIGVSPLIQGLIKDKDGRWQTASEAYDIHKKEWFNIHSGEDRQEGDWGHWTGRGMTWNFQCADCHVTNYQKNYDPEKDKYNSKWLEQGVGCEACHGPMDSHASKISSSAKWLSNSEKMISKQTLSGKPSVKIDTCAQCHSRRQQLSEGFSGSLKTQESGKTFYDHYDPELPSGDIYYADGQVKDENYEWASFGQSLMHQKGVTCMDCHQPHSGKLRKDGNLLCLQCHDAKYNSASHTFHLPKSQGNQCVSCHMPQTTYMRRHPRRDHSFSKPRPQLTEDLGIPNACSKCHTSQSARWALNYTKKWYGTGPFPDVDRAHTVEAARQGDPSTIPELIELASSNDQAIIWKASALELLGAWPQDPRVIKELVKAASHEHPLIRSRSARALIAADKEPKLKVSFLLSDPVKLVRTEAALMLSGIELSGETKRLWEIAFKEWRETAAYTADHPNGRYKLGWAALQENNVTEMEKQFRAGLKLDSHHHVMRNELARSLAKRGELKGAISLIEEGLKLASPQVSLFFSAGLLYAQAKHFTKSETALKKTVELDENYPHAMRNLGMVLWQLEKKQEAKQAFTRAIQIDPSDQRSMEALEALK